MREGTVTEMLRVRPRQSVSAPAATEHTIEAEPAGEHADEPAQSPSRGPTLSAERAGSGLATAPDAKRPESQGSVGRLSRFRPGYWLIAMLAVVGVAEAGYIALPRLGMVLPFGQSLRPAAVGAGLSDERRAAAAPNVTPGPMAALPAPPVTTTLSVAPPRQDAALQPPTGQLTVNSPGVAQTAAPPAIAAGAVTPPAPAPHPAAIVPSAPSPDEEIELQLAGKVKSLADQVGAIDARLTDLRQGLDDRIATGMGKLDGRLDELQHRQDELDQGLRTVNAGAVQKVTSAAASQTVQAPVPAPLHSAQRVAKRVRGAATPVSQPRASYRVQAGAPGLAILSDAAGDAIRVEPGTTIPGWGTVDSITEGDSGWVVKTAAGVIH